MKPIIILLASLLVSIGAYATIITVDNNYPSMGDYTNLQAAHNAASSGDSILTFPSLNAYSAIAISKKLVLLGSGFGISNPTIKTTKISGTISFIAGSNGSQIIGFGGFFEVVINDNNICVSRNQLGHLLVTRGHTATTITQNYISGGNYETLVHILPTNEVLISNNIIINQYQNSFIYTTLLGHAIRADSITNTTIITNNLIRLGSTCYYNCIGYGLLVTNSSAYVANNVIYGCSVSGNLDGFFNNICDAQQLPTNNNNINSTNMYDTFVDFDNNNYHLKSGSAAVGNGVAGVDIGIYGGSTPFIDGGLPPLPSIYYLDVPINGSTQNGVNITIKAKSNN